MSLLEIAIGIAVVAAVIYAVSKRKQSIAEPVAEAQPAPYKVETPVVEIPPEVISQPHKVAPVAEKAPATKKPRAKKETTAKPATAKSTKPATAKTAAPKAKATKAVVKKAKIRVAK